MSDQLPRGPIYGSAAPAGGRPTEETHILVCQCNGTGFAEHKRTATAVVLRCSKCGLNTSVKGRVATVRAARDEVSYAVESTVTCPEPPTADDPGAPAAEKTRKTTLGEQGYEQFRFRVSRDQAAVVRRALEAIRVQHCHEEHFRCQAWQGHALEYLAAEMLSGMDPLVLQVVDAQEEAVRAEAARVEARGKTLTTRAEGKVRIRVRDTMAAALGIVPTAELKQFPHRTDDLAFAEEAIAMDTRKREEAAAGDMRVDDGGRLGLAAKRAREALAEVDPQWAGIRLALDPVEAVDLLKWARENGGFHVQIQGDERTRDRAGRRPTVWAWLPAEDTENPFDVALEYADAYYDALPSAHLTVTELLPGDWEQLPTEDRWDAPSIAHERVVLGAPTPESTEGDDHD